MTVQPNRLYKIYDYNHTWGHDSTALPHSQCHKKTMLMQYASLTLWVCPREKKAGKTEVMAKMSSSPQARQLKRLKLCYLSWRSERGGGGGGGEMCNFTVPSGEIWFLLDDKLINSNTANTVSSQTWVWKEAFVRVCQEESKDFLYHIQ